MRNLKWLAVVAGVLTIVAGWIVSGNLPDGDQPDVGPGVLLDTLAPVAVEPLRTTDSGGATDVAVDSGGATDGAADPSDVVPPARSSVPVDTAQAQGASAVAPARPPKAGSTTDHDHDDDYSGDDDGIDGDDDDGG